MHNKIRRYINRAFASTVDSKASQDLQEEIIANLIDKYDDLLANGKKEEDAYQAVISSVGDLDHLMLDLPKEVPVISQGNAQVKKSAFLNAIAVALIIMSPVAVIAFGDNGDGTLGVILMFLMIALGTAMLIYTHESKKSSVNPMSMVIGKDTEGAYKAISGAYWLMVVAIYLSISFITSAWHITWLIFLIAGALASMMHGFMLLRGDHDE